jgi:hypothetical protein
MTIKAIETKYKGYRFRSRLEARWAICFDELGVKWEYEPQGFDLGEAGWYLPDFWLPAQQCWIEIKPLAPLISEETKAQALAEATGRWVDIISGTPGEQDVYGYRHYPYWQRKSMKERKVEIGLCNDCENLTFQSPCNLLEWTHMGHCYNCGGLTYIENLGYPTDPYPDSITIAFEAARAARFDDVGHGRNARR